MEYQDLRLSIINLETEEFKLKDANPQDCMFQCVCSRQPCPFQVSIRSPSNFFLVNTTLCMMSNLCSLITLAPRSRDLVFFVSHFMRALSSFHHSHSINIVAVLFGYYGYSIIEGRSIELGDVHIGYVLGILIVLVVVFDYLVKQQHECLVGVVATIKCTSLKQCFCSQRRQPA